MILKLNQLLHLYNHQKDANNSVKKASLTSEDKIKDDRIVTVLLFAGVLTASILSNIL